MMLLVLLRWIIFASLTSAAPAGSIWPLSLKDLYWNEPIRVVGIKFVLIDFYDSNVNFSISPKALVALT